MALWLLLQDHAAKMDEKFKTQLVHEYRKKMEEKQKSKLLKFQGMVRQLHIDGNIERAKEVLADMFNQLDHTQMVCDSDGDNDQNLHDDS
jgi:phosphoglucomutase